MPDAAFKDLPAVATRLRNELNKPKGKVALVYAHNGTGKTRLSGAFKDLGKRGNSRDTLYFNAFTEDLFYWDNDLDNDRERVLKMNARSRFDALEHLDMNSQLRPLIKRYAEFDFRLDRVSDAEWEVSFSRDVLVDGRLETFEDIKVSRGEENIFIWCFFLAIVQLVLDDDGTGPYGWVKYLYIDDPISSLDETNAISVGSHLAHLLTKADGGPRTIISTHHGLFFNVLCNEFTAAKKYFLKCASDSDVYTLSDITDKLFLHHLTTLRDLDEAQRAGNLRRHHFNMLRCAMEQTAIFLGLKNWKECIQLNESDPDKALSERMINVMSHGDYLILEPDDLVSRYKDDFKRFFRRFVDAYPFSRTLFSNEQA